MGSLGLPELLIILVIVLLVFGAGKLPQIGDSLGRAIKNFKRSAGGQDELEVGKRREIEGDRRDEADVISTKSDSKERR